MNYCARSLSLLEILLAILCWKWLLMFQQYMEGRKEEKITMFVPLLHWKENNNLFRCGQAENFREVCCCCVQQWMAINKNMISEQTEGDQP